MGRGPQEETWGGEHARESGEWEHGSPLETMTGAEMKEDRHPRREGRREF